jgi:hypothetical protein
MKDTTATSVKRLYDAVAQQHCKNLLKELFRGDADSWLLEAICGFKYQRGWLCQSEAAAATSSQIHCAAQLFSKWKGEMEIWCCIIQK